MVKRTLHSVLGELREEQHVPMTTLVEDLARSEWANSLCYDLSMLRLWISRKDAANAELMVVYADGRGGGRPSPPYDDAFETTIFSGSRAGERTTGSGTATVEKLQSWFDAECLPSKDG